MNFLPVSRQRINCWIANEAEAIGFLQTATVFLQSNFTNPCERTSDNNTQRPAFSEGFEGRRRYVVSLDNDGSHAHNARKKTQNPVIASEPVKAKQKTNFDDSFCHTEGFEWVATWDTVVDLKSKLF